MYPARSLLKRLNAFAFRNDIDGVEYSGWRDYFYSSARPANFDLVDLRRRTETEVRSRVRARCEAATSQHISPLRKAIRGDEHAGAHAIARAARLSESRRRRANEPERN